jgi:hypothetical protein
MPSTTVTKVFLAISVCGCSLTVIRLLWSGLFRRYRFFTVFFVVLAGDLLYPIVLPQSSRTYFYIWVATEPLLRILYIFVVLELYRLILEQYKGLYSLGRWALYGSSSVGVAISILTLLPQFTPAMPQRTRLLSYVYGFDRGVDLSLVIIILLMLAFLSRFPVTLSRNMLLHAALCSIYFFSESLYGLVWKILGLKTYTWLDAVFQGASALCTVAWLFLLTQHGEEVPARRIKFSPEYEARVLGELDALNQTLLKIGKS